MSPINPRLLARSVLVDGWWQAADNGRNEPDYGRTRSKRDKHLFTSRSNDARRPRRVGIARVDHIAMVPSGYWPAACLSEEQGLPSRVRPTLVRPSEVRQDQ